MLAEIYLACHVANLDDVATFWKKTQVDGFGRTVDADSFHLNTRQVEDRHYFLVCIFDVNC